MNLSDMPARFPIPFANGATSDYIRAIPTPSQPATSTDAPASLTDGFPSETFTPLDAGGIPPNGKDFNGLFNQLTAWARWLAAGGPATFDNAFVTATGGYPNGAVLKSSVTPGVRWMSIVDGNTTNPDSSGSNWIKIVALASENTGVTGNRLHADGWKEEWGRVTAPAGASVTVNMGLTHTDYITPSLGAVIVPGAGVPCYIGISAIGLNSFVITNNGAADQIVPWTTEGR